MQKIIALCRIHFDICRVIEKHERSHAAVLCGMLFLGHTTAPTESILVGKTTWPDPFFDAIINGRFDSRPC